MKPPKLLSLIAALLIPISSQAQSIRTLSYNTSNNVVIAATNSTNALTFSNAFAWSTNTLAAATRTNLAMSWSGLTNSNASGFRSALELSAAWLTNTNVTNFRSAIGLEWSALTNTNAAISFLGFTTNGQVVANTGTNVLTFTSNIVFQNLITFQDDVSGMAFDVSAGTNSTRLDDSGISFAGNAAATTRANLGFSTNLNTLWTASNADTARTNLSLGLPALTNTSNVTAMRALAGSTNTNEPYSGTVSLTNTNVLTFSNGVLLKIQ